MRNSVSMGGIFLAFIGTMVFGQTAEAAPVFQSLTVDRAIFYADRQDVQTATLIVSTTEPDRLDDVRLTVNFPLSGQTNNSPYPQAGVENNFRGYFQWTPATGFREFEWDNYGASMVNLLDATATTTLRSERIVDTASGTVTFVFRWTANPGYGWIANNDVWYQYKEITRGFTKNWTKVETNFLVQSPGYGLNPGFVSLQAGRGILIANDSDVQSIALTVTTTNVNILDDVRVMVNYPYSQQTVNPARGYFQWTPAHHFREIGAFGNQHVTLMPENALYPTLGSQRLYNAGNNTITFIFRFTAAPTYGTLNANNVWFYFAEPTTGFTSTWRRSNAFFDVYMANALTYFGGSGYSRLLATGRGNPGGSSTSSLDEELSEFTFVATSSSEAVEITSVTLTSNETDSRLAATAGDYALLYLLDNAGNVVAATTPTTTLGVLTVTFTMSPGSVVAPVNNIGGVRVRLFARLTPIAVNTTAGVSGHRAGFHIASPLHVQARGAATGSTVYNVRQEYQRINTHVIHRGLPLLIHWLAPSPIAASTTVSSTFDVNNFSVDASRADISISKFTFSVFSTGVSVAQLQLIDVTDPTAEVVLASAGPLAGGFVYVPMFVDTNADGIGEELIIASGTQRRFLLRLTASNAGPGAGIQLSLSTDNGPYDRGVSTVMGDVNSVNAYAPFNRFIWSDMSIAPHSLSSLDWTNGYLLPIGPVWTLRF